MSELDADTGQERITRLVSRCQRHGADLTDKL